jgi:hypothetical protein
MAFRIDANAFLRNCIDRVVSARTIERETSSIVLGYGLAVHSHVIAHAAGRFDSISRRKAPALSAHVCKPVGSPLHLFGRCALVYEQLRSSDPFPSRSDTPLLDKSSWAIGVVVFGLLRSGLCRSWVSWPCVMEITRSVVFVIQWEIDHLLELDFGQDELSFADQLCSVRLQIGPDKP